jgi:hypothetical protein
MVHFIAAGCAGIGSDRRGASTDMPQRHVCDRDVGMGLRGTKAVSALVQLSLRLSSPAL